MRRSRCAPPPGAAMMTTKPTNALQPQALASWAKRCRFPRPLPMFENCGLTVIAEEAFPALLPAAARPCQDAHGVGFPDGTCEACRPIWAASASRLEEVLHAVLLATAENDGFNRLVIAAGSWLPQAVILRATAKYLRQAGIRLLARPGAAGLGQEDPGRRVPVRWNCPGPHRPGPRRRAQGRRRRSRPASRPR